MQISRRQLLRTLMVATAIGTVGSLTKHAYAVPDGVKPFIKVSVNYKVRGTIPTLPAVGARIKLFRGNTLYGTQYADAQGQAIWERLPSANNYRVYVEFNNTGQWYTGGGGNILIGPGAARRPGIFFWV